MSGGASFPLNLIPLMISLVVFSLHGHVNAMSTINAMSKDQIACSMCFSCENPCEPILSPPPPPALPPPPPPALPPPPPAPSPESYYCPPPPSPPAPSPESYYCPPPPSPPTKKYWTPPPSDTGKYYTPGIFPYPSPPNSIVPYFPFSNNSLPQPSAQYNSIKLTKPTNSIIFLLIILAPFFIIFHI